MYQMKIAEIKVSYSVKSKSKIKIENSQNAFQVLADSWDKDTIELQEEFKLLILNRNNCVLGTYSVSKGGTACAVVDPKLVFSVALKCNASSLIFAHNHPSGNLKPSPADIKLTARLTKGAKLLDISVIDHIILSKYGYYSFSDDGEL